MSTDYTSNTRTIALIGAFTALYIVAAGVAGATLSPFLYGYPEHLIRGFLMTGLVVRTKRMWSATMMGLASGIVFEIAVPSPNLYLLPSTFVSGIVFDLALLIGSRYSASASSKMKVLFGAAISGVGESITALVILTTAGTLFTYSGGFLPHNAPLAMIWAIDITMNVILSLIGAYFAFRYLTKRVESKQMMQQKS